YCAAHGLLDSPPPVEPETIGRLDEKEVSRWTRCATVVDPLTLSGPAQEHDAAELPEFDTQEEGDR
ncbi:pyridoxal-5'-phosphate-dependent protein subunit beta, partial [Streptomyces albiflaviniger]|nr:pyridoxal-5'-phosphate-dependent protein subunit beta [Streptomyces albiflaviniger]